MILTTTIKKPSELLSFIADRYKPHLVSKVSVSSTVTLHQFKVAGCGELYVFLVDKGTSTFGIVNGETNHLSSKNFSSQAGYLKALRQKIELMVNQHIHARIAAH